MNKASLAALLLGISFLSGCFGSKSHRVHAPKKAMSTTVEEDGARISGASGSDSGESEATETRKDDPKPPPRRKIGGLLHDKYETPAKTEPKADIPVHSGLKAGYADDNQQFNYFLGFLKKYRKRAPHINMPVNERIMLRAIDHKRLPLNNALVRIYHDDDEIDHGHTTADGRLMFLPGEHKGDDFIAIIEHGKQKRTVKFSREGRRNIAVEFAKPRVLPERVPLDLVFVFDTTGSMGEEIQRLKSTIRIINLNLKSLTVRPEIRYGMVLYRDREDEYVTRTIPLTPDLKKFEGALSKVSAGGGGDGPEDLQSALKATMTGLKWRKDAVKMAFVITDAPAHLDYGQKYTYYKAAGDARKQGIKIFTVGTGGLDIRGEYVLRQISQYTRGKYIFLTYGEKGESNGGAAGSVSHHTGSNFTTSTLESTVVRFVKSELNHLLEKPMAEEDGYFLARKIARENAAHTLRKLFGRAVGQLVNFSARRIDEKTVLAATPLTSSTKKMGSEAEYFTEVLTDSMSKNNDFTLAARRDLQKVLAELELQQTGLSDPSQAARVGKVLGANMLVTGALYKKDDYYEVFLKLVDVETSEVLAVTTARIEPELGLKSAPAKKS